MKNEQAKPISSLFEKFLPYLSQADIVSARILSEISLAITNKRLEMELSQKEFSKLLGVSQSMISKWESQDYNFTINTIAEICEKLDLNFNVMIKPASEEYENCISYFDQYSYGNQECEGNKEYNNLTPAASLPNAG